MRLLAHFSRDSKLQEIFTVTSDGDIYKNLGARVFKKAAINITDAERKKAKTVTLGLIYGMGAELMARKLSIDKSEAKRIMDAFFAEFRQVQVWMRNVRDQARKDGFVCTLTGRRRMIANITSPNHETRAYAERQTVNSIIQGSASDMIKIAMLEFEMCLQHASPSQIARMRDVHMLMQVHDELIFEVNEETDLREFANLLNHSMSIIVCRRLSIDIPMPVDIQVGRSWGCMRKCGDFDATERHNNMSVKSSTSENSQSMDIDGAVDHAHTTHIATESKFQSSSSSRSID